MPIGLIALALASFGIGLTELVIAGLLPEIAGEFGVDEATAGWLISGYAIAVAFGAIVMTAAVTRISRKLVLTVMMVVFILGNSLCAIAGIYEMLLAGRVLAALCNGAFLSIGSAVAAGMVPAHKKAAAIGIMFAGITSASVLGVPFGTLLGQQFGWRSTFWSISAIGVVSLLGIMVLVHPHGSDHSQPTLRHELRAFRHPQVWFSVTVTFLGFGGMFGAFTYIAYTLTEVSGFTAETVPWLLFLFGVGLFLGNYVGARTADRALSATLIVSLSGLALTLVIFALSAHHQVPTLCSLFFMGLFGYGIVPGLQMRVMSFASHAPTLASGANIAAFNLGNAFGAWLGGISIASGLGYTSPIWAGAATTAIAIVTMSVAVILNRSPTHTVTTNDTVTTLIQQKSGTR